MKPVIIGTAGHVDHGKTALIKALTGIDTDRLREEKKRGITIELGFAYLDLPGGEKAGIIDVPGHEKFIKNMLAGAGGIDLALLIVAADDGVMPQTREHLGILGLLGIRHGIVAVTKADLAEPGWIELVKEDIAAEMSGTFLEGAPIVTVSAFTGQGLDELKALIHEAVGRAGREASSLPFRVPVDRVFSVDGFGTVITGTLIEGILREGDEVEVYPSGLRTRVRNLQVHSKDVETALAGQRVAVNLAGLSRGQVARGDTLAVPDSMRNTMMLDTTLHILKDSGRVIENGSRLHCYLGARETLCKVVLLDRDLLRPGDSGYAQLRFTEELAVKKDDRFVVRFYSPVETVGGGAVLDPNPQKHRRHNKKALDALAVREHGSDADRLLQVVDAGSPTFADLSDLRIGAGLDADTFDRLLEELAADHKLVRLGDRNALSSAYLDRLGDLARDILGPYHEQNPLQAGMRRDELRSRLLPGRDAALADKALGVLAEAGVLRLEDGKAALGDFTVQYGEKEKKLAELVEAKFREGGYTPPGPEELAASFPKEKGLTKLLEAMLSNGVLVSVAPGITFHRAVMEDARTKVSDLIAANGELTLARFRDESGSSRKFALALLEYFDRHGLTKKVGDARVLAKK